MPKILHQIYESPEAIVPILTHTVLCTRDGYQVVYPTPGCKVPTLVCCCRTKAAAERMAERLNQEQIGQEMANEIERELREMRRIRPQTSFIGGRA